MEEHMINVDSGSKSKQIKEDIVEDILSGVYVAGDMIPTQEEYANEYKVSRITVRKAIDDLVQKGIVRTEKGKGTFVQDIANNTYSYRRLSGFTSNVKNVKTSSKVLRISEIDSDKRLCSHLQITPKDRVVLIERLRFVADICVSYHKSYLIHKVVKDIDFDKENLNQHSLYGVLKERLGIVPAYTDEHFRAIRATSEIAGYFGMEEGDPILHVNRTTYNSQNEPIEYCENYESTDVNGIWVKSVLV